MAQLRLVIANKNYSSWSMRPWVALRQCGIAFEEVLVKFDAPQWEQRVPTLTPSGRVPVLWFDDQPVWDSLAILESIAEAFPDAGLWPEDPAVRRHARAVCAEMHAGFGALRKHMPMNIRGRHRGRGHTPEVLADVARITALWEDCRVRHAGRGDLLFGEFTAADAMFAPVVMRFATYGVELPPRAAAYAVAVNALASVREWIEGALREPEFVADDEPYSEPR